MDKGLAKIMLTAKQVPVPRGIVLNKQHHKRELSSYTMKFPVVVKPCSGGSSIGVYIVDTEEAYRENWCAFTLKK